MPPHWYQSGVSALFYDNIVYGLWYALLCAMCAAHISYILQFNITIYLCFFFERVVHVSALGRARVRAKYKGITAYAYASA